MADSTTTGSAVIGLVGGLTNGFGQRTNASQNMTDKILLVYGNPLDVVTVSVGSQLAYDVESNDVYMGLAQTGSEWVRLGSLT